MIIIKRIVIYVLLFLSLINFFPAVICNANEESYHRGSCGRTIYVRDVPIEISVCYSYEEDEEDEEKLNSFRRKHVIRIDSCSSSCKSLDYSGNLSATASYTDTTIFVSIFGTLTHKKNPNKSFLVNETHTINIA